MAVASARKEHVLPRGKSKRPEASKEATACCRPRAREDGATPGPPSRAGPGRGNHPVSLAMEKPGQGLCRNGQLEK